MIEGDFKYSKDKIEEIKDQFNLPKATMSGFYDSLMFFKKDLEDLYDKRIFHLGHGLSESGYFGWTKDETEGMRTTDNEIQKRILEIYAIILKATGG